MNAFKILRGLVLLGGLLLSACAAAPASQPAADTSDAAGSGVVSEVSFSGVIENMDGDQWVVSGQTVQVDPSVVQDGPFLVGDTVKVEARVAEDGTVTVSRVESPSAADLAATASTEMPVIFDDGGTEAVGIVEAITDTSITLGGLTYNFAPGAEIKGSIDVGALVKLHFIANADGTLSVREVEFADPSQTGDANGNDDNSNDTNLNDNASNGNGSDDNSNANDDSSNDNSNDDTGNDDNSNDDHSGDDGNDDDDDDDNSNDGNG